MQTSNKMAVAPVGKLIWQMSIPPLISMFLQYSYNLIDSAFVARLSENALTAVSLSFPITTLMNAELIVVMDHGKIVEMGKHEELIHNGGIYQQIYELQSRSAAEVSK